MMEERTLNFHLTDRCNFHCKHCFINMEGRELSLNQCKRVVDAIYEMKKFTRINLAGGEPMMAHHLQDVIDYIVSRGLKCSLITNGSYLTADFIKNNKEKLCMIGISIDSMVDEVNKLIGRKTIVELYTLSDLIKQENITLKINICISKHNLNNDFTSFLKQIKPDRLKLLQIMPTPNLARSSELIISRKEFNFACETLMQFNPICEDNDFMSGAYWIVDSEGYYGKDNLHQNHENKIKLI